MKRKLALLILLAVCLLAVPAFAAEQISFEEKAVSLFENEQLQLSVTLSEGLVGGTVQYASASPKIAAVDADGVVTGVSKGNAVITATLKTAKQTYKATIKVNVLRPVSEITLNEETLNTLKQDDGLNFALAQNLLGDFLPEEQYEDAILLERILVIVRGRKLTLSAVVSPSTASDKTFTLSSSDESVLPINKLSVTGEKAGAAILTVASVSNPEVGTRYGVLVVDPVSKLTADTLQTSIGVGGVAQVDVSFQPENATFKAVRWTSETPKVASVDESGLVTGLAKGSAVIRVTALDGSRSTDTVKIDVKLLPAAVEITDGTEFELAAGKSRALKANVLPAGVSDRSITWTSTNPEIAKVSQDGRVTAVNPGECEIVAASKAAPEIMTSVHVTVIREIATIKFTQRSLDVSAGGAAMAEVEYTPADASNPVFAFSVDNNKIATVDANGLIQAVSKGSTTVRVKTTDGSNKSASMTVNVVQMPESITLDKPEVTINTKKSTTVKATVMPKNANNRNVTWESTDPAVAKVSKDGQITAVKAGTCQIICRTVADPGVSATVSVTVQQPVTKITPAEKNLKFNVRETAQILWTVGPEDATNTAVTFTSSNTKVATVDGSGLVYGVKRGECNITIKAEDGSGTKATVKVSVLQPVEGVTMKETNVQADVGYQVRLNAQLIPSDASNTKMLWHSMDESIATVKGTGTRPTVTGQRWGTTEIVGYTEDGGYSCSAWITVENYDTAVRATDLYLDNNAVKLSIVNVSNLSISRVEFTIECYDIYNVPIMCNVNGSNYFDGLYQSLLREGESTRHGRFQFIDYFQPSAQIGRVLLTITSYRVQEGWRYDIPESKQKTMEYVSPAYIGDEPPVEDEPVIDYTVTDDPAVPVEPVDPMPPVGWLKDRKNG